MPMLKYKDPSDGQWKPVPVGGPSPDEVVLQPAEPTTTPKPDLWVDTDEMPSGTVGAIPIGTVVMFGGAVAPGGWHLCDGSAHGSTALQAVIGTTTTPDLRNKFIVGAGSGYALKATGGAATHTLSVAEMPSHGHDRGVINTGGSATNPGLYLASSNGSVFYSNTGSGYTLDGTGTATAGGGAAHNNMPPYYALTYIIRKA